MENPWAVHTFSLKKGHFFLVWTRGLVSFSFSMRWSFPSVLGRSFLFFFSFFSFCEIWAAPFFDRTLTLTSSLISKTHTLITC